MALSPVLVIGGIRWSGDIRRDNERRIETMTLVAEEAADRAEIVLSTAPAMLDVIAAISPADVCSAHFNELIDQFPQFSALGVVDANGRTMCTTMEGGQGTSAAERDWFKDLKASGQDYIQSTAYYGPVSKQWVLASAKRRSKPDGSFDGALVIGVPVSSLVYSLDRSGLPRDSEIALLDANGRVFSSRHWTVIGRDVSEDLDRREGGFYTTRTDSGDKRQVAIVPLSPGPLFAMLSAPEPAPIALENVAAFGNFALPLLAWLLALVTAWLATDWLVLRWIDYLRRIAGLYASGKMTVQPVRAQRQAPGEITVLAGAMQEMAANVRDRTSKLETAIEARDAAMKEIHHRVKNNLQIINSLLSLQSRKLSDPSAIAVLDDARSRINALSLIHRSLYEHIDIRSVDVKSFLGELVTHLDQALGAEDQRIRIESAVDDDTIDADMAVPLALFTAEAVTNAVKHAFPKGRSSIGGTVKVIYRRIDGHAELTVEDDGIGGPEVGSTGLGSTLMNAFARQLGGKMEDARSDKGGRVVRLNFPRPHQEAAE